MRDKLAMLIHLLLSSNIIELIILIHSATPNHKIIPVFSIYKRSDMADTPKIAKKNDYVAFDCV